MIPFEFRKTFCEDFKLPIKIYDSPLFEYYLNLYEEDLKISEKVKIFLDTMKVFKTPEAFSDEWHRIKNAIITDIDQNDAFKNFVNSQPYVSPYKVERGNVFNHKYKDSRILSIDLVAANFNSLRYFDPAIVFNCNNFAELVTKYSGLPYYTHVKIFRQIVFERLHSNRQQSIQRKMMDSVLTELFELCTNLELRMPSNDEIVIPLSGVQKDLEEPIKQIVANHKLKDILRVETYQMGHIVDDYFFQKFDTGLIRLRNVPSPFYSRYLKMVKNIPLTEEDSYFIYEGKKAKFVE